MKETTHLQQIALVKEQNNINVREELVRDDGTPEEEGVFETVYAGVLFTPTGFNVEERRGENMLVK